MTTENRSTTPPQWRMDAWRKQALAMGADVDAVFLEAARWGYKQGRAINEAELQKARDEELEACCEWLELHYPHVYTARLKRCRRPRPKSQAEEALTALEQAVTLLMPVTGYRKNERLDTVRRALERLRELEEGNE